MILLLFCFAVANASVNDWIEFKFWTRTDGITYSINNANALEGNFYEPPDKDKKIDDVTVDRLQFHKYGNATFGAVAEDWSFGSAAGRFDILAGKSEDPFYRVTISQVSYNIPYFTENKLEWTDKLAETGYRCTFSDISKWGPGGVVHCYCYGL